mgnify:CR=1 FL=1
MYGDTFFGRPIEYWTELQARFDKAQAQPLEVADLLQEVALMRGKISYYEDCIKQMAKIANLLKT